MDKSSVKYYIDGNLFNTVIVGGPFQFSNISNELMIGRNLTGQYWPTIKYYKGDIDDIKIYSRALSSQEVVQLKNE
jgi:hypothetical protein